MILKIKYLPQEETYELHNPKAVHITFFCVSPVTKRSGLSQVSVDSPLVNGGVALTEGTYRKSEHSLTANKHQDYSLAFCIDNKYKTIV